jgi:hypothetical protein
VAARYYFDALIAAGGPRAIVVSTGREVLAGSASDTTDLSELAITGDACIQPSSQTSAMSPSAPSELDEREDVFAHRLDLGKTTVTLTTLGSRVRHLRRVEADIRRILERALGS